MYLIARGENSVTSLTQFLYFIVRLLSIFLIYSFLMRLIAAWDPPVGLYLWFQNLDLSPKVTVLFLSVHLSCGTPCLGISGILLLYPLLSLFLKLIFIVCLFLHFDGIFCMLLLYWSFYCKAHCNFVLKGAIYINVYLLIADFVDDLHQYNFAFNWGENVLKASRLL